MMRVIWIRFSLVLACMLILAGCTFNFPQTTSADVENHRSGVMVEKYELKANRVRALSDWFSHHRDGWERSSVSYVPNLIVHAQHADGDTTTINLMSDMVIAYNKAGQFNQRFGVAELSALRELIKQN
ncbi:hypothetical protein KSF73_00915 [Burkholderiaceae bacterium DAT-1]|nr:hypothetical protein [Burkholderiaceae bacterium DAT-1]